MKQFTRVVRFEGSLATSPTRIARFSRFGDFSQQVRPIATPIVRADLLPPSIRLERKLRKARTAAAILALTALGASTIYDESTSGRHAQEVAVSTALGNQSALQRQAAVLAPLGPFFQQVAQAHAMLSGASSGNLTWSGVLAQLFAALPAGSAITSTTLSSLNGGQQRGSSMVYGTVALTGTTETLSEVAKILRALAGLPVFVDVYLTSTSAGSTATTAGISWTISADVSSRALAVTVAGTGAMP